MAALDTLIAYRTVNCKTDLGIIISIFSSHNAAHIGSQLSYSICSLDFRIGAGQYRENAYH